MPWAPSSILVYEIGKFGTMFFMTPVMVSCWNGCLGIGASIYHVISNIPKGMGITKLTNMWKTQHLPSGKLT